MRSLKPQQRAGYTLAAVLTAPANVVRVSCVTALVAAGLSCASKPSPTPTTLTIVPSAASLNAGEKTIYTVTVTNGPAATCAATSGTVVLASNQLTYTAPAASAQFTITCSSNNAVAMVRADVTGPLTVEYSGSTPFHLTEPAERPVIYISQYGPGSTFGGPGVPTLSCDPKWLSDNAWRCTFPLVPPTIGLGRVYDGPKNAVTPATNGFFCQAIISDGHVGTLQPPDANGCIAKFR